MMCITNNASLSLCDKSEKRILAHARAPSVRTGVSFKWCNHLRILPLISITFCDTALTNKLVKTLFSNIFNGVTDIFKNVTRLKTIIIKGINNELYFTTSFRSS